LNDFLSIGNVIIPIDEVIFFRGIEITNQLWCSHIFCFTKKSPPSVCWEQLCLCGQSHWVSTTWGLEGNFPTGQADFRVYVSDEKVTLALSMSRKWPIVMLDYQGVHIVTGNLVNACYSINF
jgi:hypothetical protein